MKRVRVIPPTECAMCPTVGRHKGGICPRCLALRTPKPPIDDQRPTVAPVAPGIMAQRARLDALRAAEAGRIDQDDHDGIEPRLPDDMAPTDGAQIDLFGILANMARPRRRVRPRE